VTDPVEQAIAEGQAALKRGDANRARDAFERALAESSRGAVIEGLARASYLMLDFQGAIEGWERAYATYRASGDSLGAIRVARTLAGLYMAVVGDRAVCNGWLARAQTLLGDRAGSSERGWIALNLGLFEADRERKEEHYRLALGVARELADVDLETVTLAYLGASLVHGDRIDEGMVLLDEALAATAGGEVDDFCVLEEIFCQLFSACEYAGDVGRADEWSRIGDQIAKRRELPAVSAYCRTHYGGVLIAAGRWSEADAALTAAIRLWGLGQRSVLRVGALARLALLRVRQGRFEEAEQLLEGVDADVDLDVARPLAAVYLARDETTVAAEILQRALAQLDRDSASAAPLLAFLVDVQLAAGDGDAARETARQLAACAARHPSHYLTAAAALARGRVGRATGDGDVPACLREALTAFARAQMPMEVAAARLELAAALAGTQPQVALVEARRALAAFEQLQAARQADAAAALLRSMGVRTAAARRGDRPLSQREAEVLDLLGLGLSNPEISDRLFISRKTVEHHVGNILAKLGLRGRAEAAAYAARTGKPAG
jgi:DNA-binding NarL/FixJ family response regulator